LFGYFLLTLVMTWPLAANSRTAIPGDGFDGWQNYWNLWWLKTALVDRLATPFYTDLLYYPTGVGLYFHTLNPINGLMTLPVQLAGGLIPAYNAVVLISWTLSGYGMFLLCLWLLGRSDGTESSPGRGKGKRTAAFVAGLIYTFAPFHMAHLLGHMQVMGVQWIPFYALFLLRGLEERRAGRAWLRDGLLAGLFLTLAGLTDWYFVLYLFLFTGLAVIAFLTMALVTQPGGVAARLRRLAGASPAILAPPVVAGAVFAVLLSPILVPMVKEAMQYSFMVRPVSDLYILSASLMDFLIPNRLHTLFRPESFSWPGNQIAPVSERTIAIGYAPLALAVIAVAWRSKQAALWSAVALFFVLLAMGPALHVGNITMADVPADLAAGADAPGWTPFAALNRLIPFMRISRSVSRYALMVQFSFAVLAGIGLQALLQRALGRGRAVIAAAAALLVLGEYWTAPYPLSPPDTPAFYMQLAQEPGPGAVLNLPMNYDRPGYLLYQTVHQRPLTVAYISRDDPRTLTERAPFLQHLRHLGPDILAGDPADAGMTVLADLGVEYVVLDRYKMPGGEERAVTEALAEGVFAAHAPVYADERVTAYRVASVEPEPYILLGAENWGPLEERSGAPARAVIGDSACFTVRHADDVSGVYVRYRSAPDAEAEPAIHCGADSTRLPFAPQGNSVELDITCGSRHGDAVELCLRAAEPGGLWVEELSLRAR
jgi:hypothetical protein